MTQFVCEKCRNGTHTATPHSVVVVFSGNFNPSRRVDCKCDVCDWAF